jgi:hypothetical protein
MAIFYEVYQDNREKNPHKGKFYARAKTIGTKDLRDIAEIIQRNASMKRSDVVAVLTELAEVVGSFLEDGYRVKLEGLGVLKMGIRTAPADTEKEFKPEKNIKSSHILFQAETEKESLSTRRTRVLARKLDYKNVKTLEKKAKKPKTP